MTSKTICIREEIFNKLNLMRDDTESFSDLLERILNRVDESQNNYDEIMSEVFGSGKEILTEDLMTDFVDIQREIEENIDKDFAERE